MRVFGYGAQTAGGTMEPVQFEREPLRPGEVAITFAPIAFPICVAMWPSPPNPATPKVCPSLSPNCFIGWYVVTPAHNKGAASALLRPAGMRTTNSSRTMICVE